MDHLTPDQLRDCLRRATRDERYARLMHDEHARLDAERRMRMYDMRIRHAAGEPWPWEDQNGKQSIVAG